MTSLFDIINPEIYFHRLRIIFSLLFISIFFSVLSSQVYISDNVKFSISDSTVFYISGELVTTDESIEVVENKIVKVPHRKEFETSIKSEINNEPNVKDENLKKETVVSEMKTTNHHDTFHLLKRNIPRSFFYELQKMKLVTVPTVKNEPKENLIHNKILSRKILTEKKKICTSQTNVKNHYFFESLFIRPPPSMEDISSFNTNI